MYKSILSITLVISFTLLFAQKNIAIGEWRFHPSHANATSLTSSNNDVYACTENGILKINSLDYSSEMITNFDVLSSKNPSQIAINEEGVIVIGYTDGNIDIIKNNLLYNIPDFAIFTNINSILDFKAINDISFKGTDTVFFSTQSGVLAYNLSTNLVIYEMIFNTGSPIVEVIASIYDGNKDSLYVLTGDNLYSVNNPSNFIYDITDLDLWESLTSIPYDVELTSMTMFNDTIYVGTADSGVYYLNHNKLYPVPNADSGHVTKLKVIGDTLFSIFENQIIKLYSTNGINNDTIVTNDSLISDITFSNNQFWISKNSKNSVLYYDGISFTNLELNISPNIGDYGNISYADNIIITTPNDIDKEAQYAYFSEGQWVNEDTVINASIPKDMGKINKIIKAHNAYYFGTNGDGVYKTESLSNPSFEKISFDNLSTSATVRDFQIDNNGNLWILQNNNSICKIESDGNSSCPHTILNVSRKMLIDNNNNFWFISDANLLSVYSSDFSNWVTSITDIVIDDNDNSNTINDMALDQNGQLWLASTDGIAYYSNPSLTQNFTALRPINEGFPMLNQANVEQVIVDGGNRKWVVTSEDGILLLRDDGKEIEDSIDIYNSPITTEEINDITINEQSGELFLSTAEGLYSYRTAATTTNEEAFSDVKVFPNPVPSQFGGTIGISGLASDVDVKITDISGNLVHETTAIGGTATWSGYNYTGEKAKTGVYLIFCGDEEGNETYVGKIALIE